MIGIRDAAIKVPERTMVAPTRSISGRRTLWGEIPADTQAILRSRRGPAAALGFR